MLRDLHLLAIRVSVELFMYLNNLLEVQLLEVDVHPPYEEVNKIALLQLVIPDASQSLQHLRQLSIKIIEGFDPVETLAILEHEVHAAGD